MLFTTSISVFGQASIYHPFPDSNAIWTEESYCGGCLPFEFIHRWQQFSIEGDTVIGSYTYKKIMYRAQEDTIFWMGFSLCSPITNSYLENGFYAGIRNDTSSKRVYCYSHYSQQDALLYDFNLNVGDTLPPSDNHYADTIIVVSIDSIFDGTGYRKKIILSTTQGFGTTFMVEGIGLEYGLFGFINQGASSFASYLQCMNQDNITRFDNSCLGSCETILKANLTLNNSSISFSPNPFNTNSNLEMKGNFQASELRLFNSFGQQVKRQKIISESTTISRDGIANGIYFFQIASEKEIVASGKVMIE